MVPAPSRCLNFQDKKPREGCGCPKFLAARVFRQISTLLEKFSSIIRHTFREANGCWKIGPAFRNAAGISPLRPPQPSGKKKPINIDILGGTVFGTNGDPSWDKLGPVPGTNRPFSVLFHSKIAILSRLSLGRVGVRSWDDCPAKAVRKMFMCFVRVYWFFRPQTTFLSFSDRRRGESVKAVVCENLHLGVGLSH